MNEQTAKELLQRYRSGECSPQERMLVDLWIERELSDGNWEISEEEKVQFGVQLKNAIDEARDHVSKKSIFKLWPRIAAVAAILLVVGLVVFFYTQRHLEGSAATRDLLANDIKPGGNKAYLILSNGKRLSLTDAANGELAKEAGVEITKTADGQVIYTAKAPLSPQGGSLPGGARGSEGVKYSNALNTIETPRGGQYQVRLPDGSKVWLNAASKLIYPVSFNGRGQRVVELSGEAYFEIAKVTRLSPSGRDGQSPERVPFVVRSKNQEVTVLGTHFNINSYSDEPGTKTTLLEGSVKVNNAILKPGEQATLLNNNIQVAQVDTELALAWKNNKFIFEQDNIQYIMRMIERWYDVDIIYTGPPPSGKFGGSMSKYENIEEVLKPLQSTGKVKFKIEGRKIYVTR